MKKLTQSAFQRAKNFIMDQGRALDQRRFEFHFEDGPADAVLAALTPYQNEDGGFAPVWNLTSEHLFRLQL